jgi:hypothetical protein
MGGVVWSFEAATPVGEIAGPDFRVMGQEVSRQIMDDFGLLADWQRGTELDGSVYQVAATIPFNGVQFDPEAFVTRLRAERCA